MIIDIGASINSCRGDICLIYAYDTSIDNRHTQYDTMFPLKNGKNIFYNDFDDLVEKVRQYKVEKALLIHSIEHMDCPYLLLKNINANEIFIVTPNAVTNKADWIDFGHIYSFTEASIKNLIKRAKPNYQVDIFTMFNNLDLVAHAKI